MVRCRYSAAAAPWTTTQSHSTESLLLFADPEVLAGELNLEAEADVYRKLPLFFQGVARPGNTCNQLAENHSRNMRCR